MPLESATVVPTETPLAKISTVLPPAASPMNAGVDLLVTLSSAESPVSNAPIRSGTVGMAVVSRVRSSRISADARRV